MSKKKFKDGLESIFGPSVEETLPKNSPLLVDTTVKTKKEKPAVRRTEKTSAPKHARRSSSKNFTSDLDSLFETALQETLEEKAQALVEDKPKKKFARRKAAPRQLTGLDALIRRTVEDSIEVTNGKKRVTFVFDRAKLIKLKRIAKKERIFLKDIIGDVMSQYIDQYEEANDDIDFLME